MSRADHPAEDVEAPLVGTRPFLVSIADAQVQLGKVSRDMIYMLISNGDLRAVRLGRRRLIVADSLVQLVERLGSHSEP